MRPMLSPRVQKMTTTQAQGHAALQTSDCQALDIPNNVSDKSPLGSWPFCPSQGTGVSGGKGPETEESKLFPVSSSGDWRRQVLRGSRGQRVP